VDHFQQHWLTRCEAKALEIERRRAGLQLETSGYGLPGGLRSCRENTRLRNEAEPGHLLGEAVRISQVTIDAWLKDICATALCALEPLLTG